MKTIIAGSRAIADYNILLEAMKNISWTITQVVCGMAKGADELGRIWAEKNFIYLAKFPADWNKYGRSAGFMRNEEMAKYAENERAIILWDGKSNGSRNMINLCFKYNIAGIIYLPHSKQITPIWQQKLKKN